MRRARPGSSPGPKDRRSPRRWELPSGVVRSIGAGLALLPWVLVAAGAGAEPPPDLPPQSRAPSKVANIVEKRIAKIERGIAQGRRDHSVLSDRVLHVRRNGEIELVFHAAGPTGAEERESLEALGATIVSTVEGLDRIDLPPVGMIQAWVPHNRVQRAARLSWVVAVTPPGYGESNEEESNDPPISPIDSEGVPLHRADPAHDAGITGAGMTVGVITNTAEVSTSTTDPDASNDLPARDVLVQGGSGDPGGPGGGRRR